jgi:hypothetical protein
LAETLYLEALVVAVTLLLVAHLAGVALVALELIP